MRNLFTRARLIAIGLVLGAVAALYAQEPARFERGIEVLRGNVILGGASGNRFCMEGSTADDSETCLAVTDPTADRLFTFGNADNTVVSWTLTTPTITNPTISGNTPVNVTAATVTLGSTHVGRMTTLNRAAGIAVTLPAATGTGDVYTLHVGTTFTGASTVKVNATPGTDVMQGTAILFADAGDTTVGFATAATADTIDLLGTGNSTGGIFGATIELVDSASGTWSVRYVSDAAGTEATPFSATVP